MTKSTFRSCAAGLLVPAIVALAGCGREVPSSEPAKAAATDKGKGAVAAAPKKVDDHSFWWCDEHGIPEEECSMCSSKVAKACKASGDWCDKHDRAKSQCFVCDPALKEKFAAKYRAKYGKEPPPAGDDGK